MLVLSLVAVGIALAGGYLAGRDVVSVRSPSFVRLTFGRGAVQGARFAPDGQTIVYAASWEHNPLQLFLMRAESPESRPLGFPEADILGISRLGEMALLLNRRWFDIDMPPGTLARMSLAGGKPREILEGVALADWSPEGSELAVWRRVGGRSRLEFPIGRILYKTAGIAQSMPVSPKGDMVALTLYEANSGSITLIDRSGKKTSLAPAADLALPGPQAGMKSGLPRRHQAHPRSTLLPCRVECAWSNECSPGCGCTILPVTDACCCPITHGKAVLHLSPLAAPVRSGICHGWTGPSWRTCRQTVK